MRPTPTRRALVILGLVALTAIAYAPVRHFDFVQLDDPTYVFENPNVSRGLTVDGVRWAFTTGHAANWHPVTWLSHMLDVQLFGLAAGPHHVVNVALHLLNVILLFLVLARMTGRTWPSAFVAGLFAVHPLHVESVAWVAERKDVLSTFFWLLTMAAYVAYANARSAERHVRSAYVLVVFCYALGLMTKPMLVTLPFVLLLLDFWPLGRIAVTRTTNRESESPKVRKSESSRVRKSDSPTVRQSESPRVRQSEGPNVRKSETHAAYPIRTLVIEKLPLFALAAASSLITIVVQQRGGAITNLQAIPFGPRVGSALLSAIRYVGATAWPSGLTVIYPLPDTLPAATVVGATALLVVVSFAVVRLARSAPYLVVGWLWYLGTLVPVSGLVQVGLQARADRYTYVPLVGIFIMISWGVPALVSRRPALRAVLPLAAIAVLLACTLVTFRQVRYWQDNVTLWTHATMVTLGVDEYQAHMSLGATVGNQGRLDEAARHFSEAVRLQPNAPDAHASLGIALAKQGQTSAALHALEDAARLDPANETTRRMVEALRARTTK